jgi:hypothetical protein
MPTLTSCEVLIGLLPPGGIFVVLPNSREYLQKLLQRGGTMSQLPYTNMVQHELEWVKLGIANATLG